MDRASVDSKGLKIRYTLRDHSSITSAKRWVCGVGQLLTFADKVDEWGWPNADVC